MTHDEALGCWARHAHGPCPAPDDLLLAAAQLLGDLEVPTARAALDEQARVLFDCDAGGAARAARLGVLLTCELRYRSTMTEDPGTLSLSDVVVTRTGHPLLLAVVAVALLRRSGHPAVICHAQGRWLAAITGNPLVVLDPEPGSRPRPQNVRPMCGHLAGFAVLHGLQRAYARAGQPTTAATCGRLVDDLPVEDTDWLTEPRDHHPGRRAG